MWVRRLRAQQPALILPKVTGPSRPQKGAAPAMVGGGSRSESCTEAGAVPPGHWTQTHFPGGRGHEHPVRRWPASPPLRHPPRSSAVTLQSVPPRAPFPIVWLQGNNSDKNV